MSQQGDVKQFQTPDAGDITVVGGIVAMDGGLGTSVYLSLFGGNETDPGLDDLTAQWWGNYGENDASRRYRSETQHLLQSLPITSGNLRRIEDAARRDLKWMITEGVATSIGAAVTVTGLNRINIRVTIEAEGEADEFEYSANWEASA